MANGHQLNSSLRHTLGVMIALAMATAIAARAAANEPAAAIDREFITTLSTAGVLTAAEEMGLDASTNLLPLAERVDHPYRQYRWSVDYAPDGSSMINALPPEEEVGWTPWERWWRDGDTLRHESWVLYPIKRPSQATGPECVRKSRLNSRAIVIQ